MCSMTQTLHHVNIQSELLNYAVHHQCTHLSPFFSLYLSLYHSLFHSIFSTISLSISISLEISLSRSPSPYNINNIFPKLHVLYFCLPHYMCVLIAFTLFRNAWTSRASRRTNCMTLLHDIVAFHRRMTS